MSAKRILIVDDERLTRISLADFLQEADYEVYTAGDGESALQLQQECPFDVCIVDIRMPNIDGVETILALHNISAHSRYLIYTGSPQFTLTSALLELGISKKCLVRKPIIDMSIFITLIEQILNE
jgi:YesN/AraC family two-component response regulator